MIRKAPHHSLNLRNRRSESLDQYSMHSKGLPRRPIPDLPRDKAQLATTYLQSQVLHHFWVPQFIGTITILWPVPGPSGSRWYASPVGAVGSVHRELVWPNLCRIPRVRRQRPAPPMYCCA